MPYHVTERVDQRLYGSEIPFGLFHHSVKMTGIKNIRVLQNLIYDEGINTIITFVEIFRSKEDMDRSKWNWIDRYYLLKFTNAADAIRVKLMAEY